MALLSVIRRWHFRDGIAIREIVRRTGLSRNTVRKYLSSGDVEPSYPKRKTPSKLDAYEATLRCWLQRESFLRRKERRCIGEMHVDLVSVGYSGSYDRVAAFARQWREEQRKAADLAGKGVYVPLSFAPGEAFQFDWSEEWVVVGGRRTKLQVAQFKLCFSRAFMLRAYPLQTHEMLYDAHNHALAALGGVPERGIYDNMKTAVDKVGRGKRRTVNTRFQALVSHFLFEAEFCNPAAGWEKGRIEKNVQDARRRIWRRVPSFKTLEDLNTWLEQRCRALWQETRHPEHKDRWIAELWAEEREHLMPVPAPFDGFVEHTKSVSSTCLITHDHDRYSVPSSFANQPVSVRVYATRLAVVADARIVAEHERVFTRDYTAIGKTVYDWRHYLGVARRKPGAVRNGAPFMELPDSFRGCPS